MPWLSHAVRWLVFAAALAACNASPYLLGGPTGDGGTGDGGGSGGDDGGGGGGDGGGSGDGGGGGDGTMCVPQLEACNAADDDCDGKTDEGFMLDKDPSNCGSCGNRCSDPTMTQAGTCMNSTCQFTCLPGKLDLDPNVPGCEYTCTPTNGGVESCDFADNDCDGTFDENIDTLTDVNNCGGCGRVCTVLNATEQCRDVNSDGIGDCTFSSCDAGFGDVFPMIPGCEYACPVFPAVGETCDFVDQDCDGRVDEGTLPGAGGQCTAAGFEALGDTGRCTFGTRSCSAGSLVCQGYIGPLADAPGGKENACNSADDDCDGSTDEGYDLQTDVRNCGTCGNDCTGVVPNAIAACVSGACGKLACLPGWVDLTPATPGCDYQCMKSGETDVCDGIDNDCDGDIDDEVTLPTGFCRTNGACAGTSAVCALDPCTNRKRIYCPYGSSVELDAVTCDVESQESRCDNVDNDCDGATDESFPAKKNQLACDDGDVGACKRVGVYACNATQNGVTCDFTNSPPDQLPQPEICNGLDDNCNGTLDENAPDTMVTVTNSLNQPLFRIDAYEASRPNATMSSPGTMTHRSCSQPLRMPWSSVTQTQAAAACAAAGKRMCTATEWQQACEGLAQRTYPYGSTYAPNSCNGNDYDPDCALPDSDGALATGSSYGCPTPPAQSVCVSQWGAYDLSGNLKEWTSTQVQPGVFNVRGGGFDSAAGGMTCQFDFVSMEPTFTFPNLGFRCCTNP